MGKAMKCMWVLTLTLVAAAGLSTAGAQESLKLGVFDPQRVSEETVEGKRIQAKLAELRNSRQKEIADEQAKINELQQQLEQQALSLSSERRTEMEIDIQRRMLDLDTRREMLTKGFQLEIAAAEAQFNEKLRLVINQFARDEEFSVILEAGAVAFAATSVDVTTAVIDLFDKMYPGAETE